MTPTTLAVHAHFYQPPRENPWTEEVPREAGAAPYHDWNARIAAECYRPNAFARILDGHGRVLSIVNNYSRLSWNVGPTLASWLERHEPEAYARIIAAQHEGGGGIAQAWNHMILPLANPRDLRTQVRWGLADFRHRFGTEAAGIWLPETAVNDDVLGVLAEEGVRFTILAPRQARAVRPLVEVAGTGPAATANQEWRPVTEATLDTRVAYRWAQPTTGAGVDLVFYDGALSHDMAFSALPSEKLVDRALAAPGRHGGLVTVALDGETFGHHHKWTDRALAYALGVDAPRRGLLVANVGDWLSRHRPRAEAAVHESAWSCVHGVGRWARNCGCATGEAPGANQEWRAPLRAALDLLRDFGAEVFERRGADLFAGGDPWAARDAYVEVLLGATSPDDYAARYITGDRVEAFTLLEAQRQAMLMYTSCGWFFWDLAGLETAQVLRYAARCMDLLAEAGETPPEKEFLHLLAQARSHSEGDGRQVWERLVLPARVDAERVAAHLVLSDLFGLDDPPEPMVVGGFTVTVVDGFMSEAADASPPVAWRHVHLRHRRTGRVTEVVAAALRTGDMDATGALARGPVEAATLGALRRAAADPATTGVTLADALPGRTFDTTALLPEATERLLERASARLAEALAAAAEPFLAAAAWAQQGQAIDSDPDGRRPGLLSATDRASATAALGQRLEELLNAGEVDGAAALVARAEQLEIDPHPSPDALASALAGTILAAVNQAMDGPGFAGPALQALALAAVLGLEPSVEVAQERLIVVLPARPDLHPLADALGISPDAASAPATPADETG